MVEIGDYPILWHILKINSHHGFNDFVSCLGYEGSATKECFANYFLHSSDVTLGICTQTMQVYRGAVGPWRVTLVETGAETQTGGRLKRVAEHVSGETLQMTYGDSAADVNVKELVAFHQAHGKLATMTAVQPPGRFGAIDLAEDGESAVGFREKPRGNDIWVDGGFFVLKPRVLDRVAGDDMALEREPLETVALGGQSSAHPDSGLGQAMDVLRDKIALKEPCRSGSPPWRVW